MSQFGKLIRKVREQKGYSLSEFAKILGVSAGYLSNLETGKTENIKLCILERLQDELLIHPLHDEQKRSEKRLERAFLLLRECQKKNPSLTNHFLTQFEQSLEFLTDI